MSRCNSLDDGMIILLCSLLVIFGNPSKFSLCGIASSSSVKQVSKYSANASDFLELVSYLAILFF